MGLVDKLRGNASSADISTIQQELAPILIEGETVDQAFVFVRDQIILTNKRLIFVDKQGMTGKKRSYQSIPYSKITRFTAETAGFMDTDAELKLWIGSATEPIGIEISRSVGIQEVYKALSRHVLA